MSGVEAPLSVHPGQRNPTIELFLVTQPGRMADPAGTRPRRIAGEETGPVLGSLLSRATRLPAEELRWEKDRHGKPHFVDRGMRRQFSFSYSHAEGSLLLAVSDGRPIGVDLEVRRPIPERDSIIERYFHPDERADYESTPIDEREAAFVRLWVRKEAFVKAVGLGLSMDLCRFSVATPDGRVRLADARLLAPGAPKDWWMFNLTLPAPFLGAVCTDHPAARLRLHAEEAVEVPNGLSL